MSFREGPERGIERAWQGVILIRWQICNTAARYDQDTNAVDRFEEELQEQLRMRGVNLQERRLFHILVWRCSETCSAGLKWWDCIHYVSHAVAVDI